METKADGGDSSLVLIKQGAEARVFESDFVGRRSIVKERFSKKYRHPSLDAKLTLKRLNAEARCMTKARRLGVYTPVLYHVDTVLHTLTFEYVEGPSVKDVFLRFGLGDGSVAEERIDDIAMQIGQAIAKLHDGGLIHGDLTTSNLLIRASTNQLVVIDFGLSFTSTLPEDKAVDLYVLERALLSMHSSCGNVFRNGRTEQSSNSLSWPETFVLEQLLEYKFLAYGSDTCCVSEVLKAVVIHIKQVSSSETTRPKAHHGWMSAASTIIHIRISKGSNATAVTATCTNLCHSRHCHLYQSLVCHRCRRHRRRTNHYSATATSHTTTLTAINHPDIMPPSPPPLPIMPPLPPPVQITPPSQRIMPPQPTKLPVPPAEGLDIAGAPREAGEVDMSYFELLAVLNC
ncbi:hypothetical protein C1H46_019266 [Malus baccata]|uniref:non-specific serine/threonine protein kinase n=1 Tax=Malus baccata TaxID=106549 RepID=A0A540M8N4_MALBA|nr:hypothetical protein C1H46_019266 [Malus baccata]